MEQRNFTTGNLKTFPVCTSGDETRQKSQYNLSPSWSVDLRLGTFHDPARETATKAMNLQGGDWSGPAAYDEFAAD